MIAARWFAAIVFICATIGATVIPSADSRPGTDLLVADLHVHPHPGDGVLTLSQLQREARRRGVDVLGITGHNNQFALRLERPLEPPSSDVIILAGQEVTTPAFHLIAVGIQRLIDWRLSVPDAVREIHQQGGVAIAAHPIRRSWQPLDDETLAALDGVEVAHPLARFVLEGRQELDAFFSRVQSVRPDAAPIGSTDFHLTAPLGDCRTHLLVDERSAAGVLDAIRRGRTVAEDFDGRLFGQPQHRAVVERHRSTLGSRRGPSPLQRTLSATALAALAVLALPARRRGKIQ